MELLIALIAIVLWVFSGVLAAKRDRSVVGWMVLGFFTSSFVTVILLLVLPNKRAIRLAREAAEERKEEQRSREHRELIAALAGKRPE